MKKVKMPKGVYERTKEHNRKISEAKTGKNNPNFQNFLTNILKDFISKNYLNLVEDLVRLRKYDCKRFA